MKYIKKMLILSLLSLGFVLSCQSSEEKTFGRKDVSETSYDDNINICAFPSIRPPVFPGCEKVEGDKALLECFQLELHQFMAKNKVYPQEAIDKKLEGKVYIQFRINTIGVVEGIKVVRGTYEILNQNAIDLIKRLPKMKPARNGKEVVSELFVIPVKYKLNEREEHIENTN